MSDETQKELRGKIPALRFFEYDHLPPGTLRATSKSICDIAYAMADALPMSAELSAGIRKLLEAKDCLVRACLPPLD